MLELKALCFKSSVFFKKVFDNLQSLQTYNLQATIYNLQPRIIFNLHSTIGFCKLIIL